MAFSIKQGDTAPAYVFDLQDDVNTSPTVLILTSASSVKLKMRLTGTTGTPALNEDMDITDAANGRVTYEWQAGDTDTAGTFDVEFEIHWSDGTVETVPNVGYKTIIVVGDLDD